MNKILLVTTRNKHSITHNIFCTFYVIAQFIDIYLVQYILPIMYRKYKHSQYYSKHDVIFFFPPSYNQPPSYMCCCACYVFCFVDGMNTVVSLCYTFQPTQNQIKMVSFGAYYRASFTNLFHIH